MAQFPVQEERVSAVPDTPSSFSLQDILAALNALKDAEVPCASCRARGAIIPQATRSAPGRADALSQAIAAAPIPSPDPPAPAPTPTTTPASTPAMANLVSGPNFAPGLTLGTDGVATPLAPPSANRWYSVTRGRRVGIFQGWAMVQPFVTSVSNACYSRYGSAEEATAAFEEARAAGVLQVLP